MNVRDEIERVGGVLEGDYFFALKSGRVSQKYINIDPLFTNVILVGQIAGLLVRPFMRTCDAIVGPAVGGIPLCLFGAQHARNLTYRPIETAWVDKQDDGSFAFNRMGFVRAVEGKRVLVVEDIATSGKSARAAADCVRAAGGEVVAVSMIWNRGGLCATDLGVPQLEALIVESVETWTPTDHPRWGKLPLVTDIGHPEHFPDYPGPKIELLQ